MNDVVRICLAGEGAFGKKHLAGLRNIAGVEIAAIVGGDESETQRFASVNGVATCSTNLGDILSRDDIDGVILATPTPLHAEQAIQTLNAAKHVEIEIPIADNLGDARRIVEAQASSGRIAMAGHTRRYNPSHQWMRQRLQSGELQLQHLVVETYFLRRSNLNAEGKPRSWTDHLLWHHACHTVDLFQFQTNETATDVCAVQGPRSDSLGIAMDMSISMRVPSGALCSLSLSFNNDGPFGTFFRYICDNGTYIARYDDLVDGYDEPIDLSGVDVSMNGIELQDRDFIHSIRTGEEPRASVANVLAAMETLDRIDQVLIR